MIPESVRRTLHRCRDSRPEGRYMTVPREAITWGLSYCGVLTYALLRNRLYFSRTNGWVDEAGEPYVVYSVRALSRDLGASETTIRKVLGELEENGLLTKTVCRGKSARLYLWAPRPAAPVKTARGRTGYGLPEDGEALVGFVPARYVPGAGQYGEEEAPGLTEADGLPEDPPIPEAPDIPDAPALSETVPFAADPEPGERSSPAPGRGGRRSGWTGRNGPPGREVLSDIEKVAEVARLARSGGSGEIPDLP